MTFIYADVISLYSGPEAKDRKTEDIWILWICTRDPFSDIYLIFLLQNRAAYFKLHNNVDNHVKLNCLVGLCFFISNNYFIIVKKSSNVSTRHWNAGVE